ncbi:MAG: hypothetical protein ACOVVK_05860, partial [Elsteraceae bacterium]
ETVTFPSVVGLEMGFNPTEDRVVMLARTHSAGIKVILLTRRMMGQLLSHYAEVMKRTSPAVARAASAHQNEVLQMEHVSALLAGAAAPTPTAKPLTGEGEGDAASDQPAQTAHLVTEVRMQVNDSHLTIGFIGPSRFTPGVDETLIAPIAAATMDRVEAHRFLALLNDKAKEGGWGLEGLCPWLTSDGLAPSAQLQVN